MPTLLSLRLLLLLTLFMLTAAGANPFPTDSFMAVYDIYENETPVGTMYLQAHEKQVRLEETDVTLFTRHEEGYRLQGYRPEGGTFYSLELDAALSEGVVYASVAEFLLRVTSPESPLHPCRYASLPGFMILETRVFWLCTERGTGMLEGRPVRVWHLERWQVEGETIWSDGRVVWFDRVLGIPLRLEDELTGRRYELRTLELGVQDAAFFRLPEGLEEAMHPFQP